MAQNIQNQIFELILNRFPKKSDAVEELSQLFSIGKDAIYRRMRGESVLTPDELQKLAVKFNISLDALAFENKNSVFFTF
ncbi:MAG TPA: helix-turn-helix transcriptional regulator, partial [Saprospiraceae bacterium]|nr:helix-turn-helix transcriptional regulator [Saprospiraceae bacterium]